MICSSLPSVAEASKDLDIRLVLDCDARLERDARRKGGQSRASDYARARLARLRPARQLTLRAGDDRQSRSHLCKRCSSQLSLTGHLNRGFHGIFKIDRVVSRGFVSIAEVHAIIARAHLA